MDLDLEGVRAEMRGILVAYMKHHLVHPKNHLPSKDLVVYGMNFDCFPDMSNFYDPIEHLQMEVEVGKATKSVEKAEDGGSDIEDVGRRAGKLA